MQVLKMVMHVTVEMPMTSLFQLILENVTFHALAIKVNSVAAHGVYKYMIPEIKMVTILNTQFVEVNVHRLNGLKIRSIKSKHLTS